MEAKIGLDMYLDARRYISSYRDEDKPIMEAISKAIPDRGDMPLKTVVCEAAYWRKANHIHRWFVENVQDGDDDCGTYYVDNSKLEELRDVCKEVLANHSRAKDLLPTQSGFFFGGTEYDENYFNDLTYTVEQLDKLLTEQYKNWDFSYHSSW